MHQTIEPWSKWQHNETGRILTVISNPNGGCVPVQYRLARAILISVEELKRKYTRVS